MQQLLEQEETITALVNGCIAELARRGFDISLIGCSPAVFANEQTGSWRRVAQSIEDAHTAEQAYFALCQRVSVDHSICRVLLDDVAEWLVLSPMVYRRIRKASKFQHKQQIAA